MNSRHKKSPFRGFFDICKQLLLDTVSETLVEAIDSAAGIDHFLLAGVKGVTRRANIQVDVFAQCGHSLDHISATAGCSYF
jgi:hypothetical protein